MGCMSNGIMIRTSLVRMYIYFSYIESMIPAHVLAWDQPRLPEVASRKLMQPKLYNPITQIGDLPKNTESVSISSDDIASKLQNIVSRSAMVPARLISSIESLGKTLDT
jgi:uncharacterized protein (DUF2252 family)